MEFLPKIGILFLAYCIGSIPWGYILVKLVKGEDIREVASGRTGGTNAMRAAGFALGFTTALLDIMKTACVVWIAQYLYPNSPWFHVLSPLIALVGHNYSIYLIRRDQDGKITVGGGAGGTPAVGGIVGLWWPSIFILLPAGYFMVMIIGYASLATMSLPLIGTIILLIRFITIGTPWQYIFFGLLAEIFIIWALRPNIKRLMNGTERLVGIRAKKTNKTRE